ARPGRSRYGEHTKKWRCRAAALGARDKFGFFRRAIAERRYCCRLSRKFPGRACKFATELGSIFVLRITAPKIQLRSYSSASDTPVVLGEDGKGANSGLDIAGDV